MILKFNNDTLEPFLKDPQPKWVKCRWINVNGLSWDVIQVLGRHKNLHKLAIEDIMNTRNRTKAEWYARRPSEERGWMSMLTSQVPNTRLSCPNSAKTSPHL